MTAAHSFSVRSARREDLDRIETLLRADKLPVVGVRDHWETFLVAESGGRLAGCAGLEVHGDSALLRSVAVDSEFRGAGLGGLLTLRSIDAAIARQLKNVALLTETADGFFPRFGFVNVPWESLPPALSASEELRGACSKSARAMILHLDEASGPRI